MASSAAPVSGAIPFPRAYAKRRPRVPPERRSHAILLVLPVFRFTPLALRLQIHRRFAGLPGSFRDLHRLCGAGAARAVCRFPAAASPSAYPTAVFRRSAWAAVFWAACPASVDRRHAARGPASACRFPASPSAARPFPAPPRTAFRRRAVSRPVFCGAVCPRPPVSLRRSAPTAARAGCTRRAASSALPGCARGAPARQRSAEAVPRLSRVAYNGNHAPRPFRPASSGARGYAL